MAGVGVGEGDGAALAAVTAAVVAALITCANHSGVNGLRPDGMLGGGGGVTSETLPAVDMLSKSGLSGVS